MSTALVETPKPEGPSLIETQRTLVVKKFEILREASFGFTQDRLLHISHEDSTQWTTECVETLRRKIIAVAPPHIKIALIDFPALRCVSLQCLPLETPRPPSHPSSPRTLGDR